MTITAGATAIAASTEGAREPTAIPSEAEAILSTVRIVRKFLNLPGAGFKPHILYIIPPVIHGKNAERGSSASSLEMK
eukprot:CAMPEP_0182441042 /NCGR_PEP_ID=MMETSP1167-20130531/87456_1 /TAXON_ID=2988 /ORGANISM="Mallomonas Sp, Strain CCMP3275" /LENGTH=77 /DNA_ID=CAMNT_0024635179 /DNA_START=578 /DNA_END=811 /DNA_ORIENTATION=+